MSFFYWISLDNLVQKTNMDATLKNMDLAFCGSGKHKIALEKFMELKDIVFLDVRAKEEIQCLSFNFELFGKQTIQIPVEELPDRFQELPKDKLIACFCSSGTRSAWAYIYLFDKGYNARWLSASNEDLATVLKPGRVLKAIKKQH